MRESSKWVRRTRKGGGRKFKILSSIMDLYVHTGGELDIFRNLGTIYRGNGLYTFQLTRFIEELGIFPSPTAIYARNLKSLGLYIRERQARNSFKSQILCVRGELDVFWSLRDYVYKGEGGVKLKIFPRPMAWWFKIVWSPKFPNKYSKTNQK